MALVGSFVDLIFGKHIKQLIFTTLKFNFLILELSYLKFTNSMGLILGLIEGLGYIFSKLIADIDFFDETSKLFPDFITLDIFELLMNTFAIGTMIIVICFCLSIITLDGFRFRVINNPATTGAIQPAINQHHMLISKIAFRTTSKPIHFINSINPSSRDK
ncbi:MAG: hypothetical protein COT74_01700 [Bdellovibrionales bacterium CG10_big_fil_rev_8_21_14_0_10_45_34]|nr:MAG: hypothetical protein COT74_01700 [Bdellovibrionales bacterium CG10_big_fil_rev_8_21_14_0_10_45_34]